MELFSILGISGTVGLDTVLSVMAVLGGDGVKFGGLLEEWHVDYDEGVCTSCRSHP